MAQPKTFLKIAFALALTGTLFSGYLSATKLFTGTCAFNEPCPYFLGYPACWYGFAMFATMFIVSAIGLYGKVSVRAVAKTISAVSFLGTIFAGSFVAQEVYQWAAYAGPPGYGLILPTCLYGLVFYAALLAASVKIVKIEP